MVRVAGAGINRADLLQRQGFYPPPPGASDILGLEASGVVASVGAGVSAPSVGDRVMLLVEGGAYAELVAVRAAQVVPVPDNIDLIDAGGIPEVFITAHDALFTRGRLQDGETVLIHGGGGGVGTAAIQLARQHDCRILVTAGSADKIARCLALGADAGINYRTEDFVARTRELTDGRGADLVLDIMGASYLGRNIDAVATDGRIVVIGMQGGNQTEIDLGADDAAAHLPDLDRAASTAGGAEGGHRCRIRRRRRARTCGRTAAAGDRSCASSRAGRRGAPAHGVR